MPRSRRWRLSPGARSVISKETAVPGTPSPVERDGSRRGCKPRIRADPKPLSRDFLAGADLEPTRLRNRVVHATGPSTSRSCTRLRPTNARISSPCCVRLSWSSAGTMPARASSRTTKARRRSAALHPLPRDGRRVITEVGLLASTVLGASPGVRARTRSRSVPSNPGPASANQTDPGRVFTQGPLRSVTSMRHRRHGTSVTVHVG